MYVWKPNTVDVNLAIEQGLEGWELVHIDRYKTEAILYLKCRFSGP